MATMRPKIAIAMNPAETRFVLTEAHHERLEGIGILLNREPITAFTAASADTEVLLTGWGCAQIDGTVLDRLPALRLIAHAGGTVKDFLAPAALDRGIRLSHAAEANAQPVAEFTLAAILFANKRVFALRDEYRQDRDWSRVTPMLDAPIGNHGRIIGIVGASRIGRRLIALLKPFDFRILVFDPFLPDAEAASLGVASVPLDDLLGQSDVVSLHVPALPATRHMIGAAELALIRDGATLINTARGSVIDEAALVAALTEQRFSAIIDVTEPEVAARGSPLYELPNVFLTPHIAGSIGLERSRLGDVAVGEIERFAAGEPLLHEIRRADWPRIA